MFQNGRAKPSRGRKGACLCPILRPGGTDRRPQKPFTGKPAIECRRDDYFARVRSEFPVVAVPNAELGKGPALQPYQFRSEDEFETIMVAINRFAYSTKRYAGFGAFKPRALKLTREFCRLYGIVTRQPSAMREGWGRKMLRWVNLRARLGAGM